jgi:outer membrane usher protein FimD/PapC
LSFQTGAAIDPSDLALGGRELHESAVVATLDGVAPDARFEVLVNEQPLGHVGAGGRLPIFLQPYHHYAVRLRPVGAASVWYDSAARDVTLYPGTVQHLNWRVEQVASLFGRAVRADGTPVANAAVQGKRGIGESDALGYFQIDAGSGDSLRFTAADGASCIVRLGDLATRAGYVSLGKVVCQ